MLKQFEQFIEEYAQNNGKTKQAAFTCWYADIRFRSRKPILTEGKDGGIDFIFSTEREIIFCQTTYGKSNVQKVRAFSDTIDNWTKSESAFNSWLDQVKNNASKESYRKIYSEKGDKRLAWEFVSLDKWSKAWENIFKKHQTQSCSARLVSVNEVLYYFSLDKVGASYVDSLRVDAATTSALNYVIEQSFGKVQTLVCLVNVPSLLKCLEKSDDWERILSRNVRVKRSKSSVNEGIQDTYVNTADEFFYGNNGLHIIASSAYITGDEL